MPTVPEGSESGAIVGGAVLLPGNAELRVADIGWSAGHIVSVARAAAGARASEFGQAIDASGALVLPGIVDLHGDAFERSLSPRPGLMVDFDVALADNQTQMMAWGVTTSYLSATDSWEPGLRSRETLRELIRALDATEGPLDLRLHLRHERGNTESHEELLDWIADGTVKLLSLNDHLPGGTGGVNGLSESQVQRSGVSRAELEALADDAVARSGKGAEQELALAAKAREAGCPIASHDTSAPEHLERDLALGAAFTEFPMSIELARRYLDHGLGVLLGAPNLARGGSHMGNLSVANALRHLPGCMLCSDYHYPSLLQGPFVASSLGLRSFTDAWSLVSETPAAVAGLSDRGRIELGRRADLLVVEPPNGGPPRVRAVVVGGVVRLLAP